MFKAIRKLLRRLFFALAILLALAVVLILCIAPKLLINFVGFVFILWLFFHGVLGVCNSMNRGGTTWPDDEQMNRRQDRGW